MKEIPLKKGVAAWVDDDIFAEVGGHQWYLHANGTAYRDGRPFTGLDATLHLPRLVMAAHSGQSVKHQNNVKLDCRRENLVVVPEPPSRCSRGEDLSAIVLHFRRAFPQQRKFHVPVIRLHLRHAWHFSLLTVDEFLQRIADWAQERPNVAPWDLGNAAPVRHLPKADAAPPPTLPSASEKQAALVRSIHREWRSDGTV